MEQNNISLQYGIHRTPSLGADSELSECVNLIPQNGELVNIQEPIDTGITLPTMYNGAALNDVVLQTRALLADERWLFFTASEGAFASTEDGSSLIRLLDTDSARYIKAFGRIVIVYTEGSAHYFRYSDGGFISLGNKFPRLFINFGLRGNFINANDITEIDTNDEFELLTEVFGGDSHPGLLMSDFGVRITNNKPALYDGNGNRTSELKLKDIVSGAKNLDGVDPDTKKYRYIRKNITEAALARVNPFIQRCKELGYFCEPFLVTYCIRLYDGTRITDAPIVLMVPDTTTMPHCVITGVSKTTPPALDKDYMTSLKASVYGTISSLDMRVLNSSVLTNWEDLIDGVDIFVSKPLTKYVQDGNIIKFTDNYESENSGVHGFGYYAYVDIQNETGDTATDFKRQMFSSVCSASATLKNPTIQIELPQISDSEYIDMVRDCSSLFCVRSFSLAELVDLGDNRKLIDLSDGQLIGIESREAYIDEYQPYSDFIPSQNSFDYNGRLHLFNYKKTLDSGWPISSVFQYVNPDGAVSHYMRPCLTREHEGQVSKKIYNSYEGTVNMQPYGQFYAYLPDEYATNLKSMLHTSLDLTSWSANDFNLKRHKFLCGAVYFNGFGSAGSEETPYSTPISYPEETDGLVFNIRNRIQISANANPFAFIRKSAITMPSNILALSTAAKAVTQGQFGQFPLYAFCEDGIWALSVSGVGTYEAKQPASRDILTAPDSVTQIDGAVVFVTNQGLKIIQGYGVASLSEAVEGLNLNETFIEDAVDIFADKFSMTSPFVEDDSQFVQQVQTAKIVYDYPHNLLHIFFEDTDDEATMHIHYVYDFVSKQWSKQALPYNLKAVVPGYPLTTMQFDNALYQYDKTADNTMRIGYALTRPLALGNPLARKALYDLRVVGQKTSQHSLRRVAVWVSNDNVNWHRLTSLKALSAKYYRFLIMTYHNDIDTVSGLALQYDERYNHKMRGH